MEVQQLSVHTVLIARSVQVSSGTTCKLSEGEFILMIYVALHHVLHVVATLPLTAIIYTSLIMGKLHALHIIR